jgi:hypothetical protein
MPDSFRSPLLDETRERFLRQRKSREVGSVLWVPSQLVNDPKSGSYTLLVKRISFSFKKPFLRAQHENVLA